MNLLARAGASIATVCALAASGACGDEPAPGEDGRESAIELTLQADGRGGPSEQVSLGCTTGDPGTAAACDAASSLPRAALEPVPRNARCTEQFGGPDLLTVSGTIDGAAVEVELSRADGCEIDRFEAWMPVIGEVFPDYEPGASLDPPQ